MVAIENPDDVSVKSSRNTGQPAVLKFTDELPLVAASCLRPSLSRPKQPSGNHSF
ncbi:mCG1049 [Mus musculus]|nr:mCG1049 [Mus musculus]